MANHADIPNGITLKNPHKSSPFRRKKRAWVEKKKIHYHSLTAVAIAAAGKFYFDSGFQIPDSGYDAIWTQESGIWNLNSFVDSRIPNPVSSLCKGMNHALYSRTGTYYSYGLMRL
jgi:hypothetical protein